MVLKLRPSIYLFGENTEEKTLMLIKSLTVRKVGKNLSRESYSGKQS